MSQSDKIHSVGILFYVSIKGGTSDDTTKTSGRQRLIVDIWYNIFEGQGLFKRWALLIRFPPAFLVISLHILFSVDGDRATPCGHQTAILWPFTIHKWRT